jgi:hypothetical protein
MKLRMDVVPRVTTPSSDFLTSTSGYTNVTDARSVRWYDDGGIIYDTLRMRIAVRMHIVDIERP